MAQYNFQKWEDNSTNPTRSLNIQSATTITGTYVEVIMVANVTFTGKVTPITVGPRSVTVVVTLPGGVIDTLPAVMTDAQGNFTTTKQYPVGQYSAVANAAADSQNAAGSSPSVPFTVGLATTTVTLTVTVA